MLHRPCGRTVGALISHAGIKVKACAASGNARLQSVIGAVGARMVVAFLCVAVRWVFPSIILSRGIEKSVDNTLMLWYSYKAVETVNAPVAQLDRVFGYEPHTHPLEGHHKLIICASSSAG